MGEKRKQVEEILERYVTPRLARHGGSASLEEIRNDTAYIRFTGHCSACPSAKYTLESIVKEEILKYTDAVRDVKLAEGVSDELYDFAKKMLRHEI
ncbi:MAG: NifU family protein [Lachnospiraceae bacterium]|nr:NifU family protein [Lachnospiraceae bacterium]